MKDQILLPEGTYYKANLHCHTTLSDGHLTPQQVKEEYQKQGYSIIAYTAHRKCVHHPELDDENFLSLAALEVDVTEEPTENREWPVLKCYHLNLFDTNPAQEKPADLLPKFQYGDLEGLNRYIQQMRESGFWCATTTPTGLCRTGGTTAG